MIKKFIKKDPILIISGNWTPIFCKRNRFLLKNRKYLYQNVS